MKYKLLRLSLLSMLVMFFGGLAFADQVTMKYSGTTSSNMVADGTNEAQTFGLDPGAWEVIGDKGQASNAPGLNKAGDFRLYYNASGSNTITVQSLTQATINSIAITFTGENYSNVSVTVDGSAVTGNNGVFDINSTSFVLGNANTSNVQVRISEIVITYGEAVEVDNRIATTMTIGEHQTTGIVKYSMDVPEATVRDASGAPVNVAYIDWRSSDETVAGIADGNISFLQPGTTTITASFAGDNQYKPCSASFTLTVTPQPYTSIAAMLEDITSTRTLASYKFENLLVTYVNGSNTYVSDGKDGFLFYGSNVNLVAGYTYQGLATGQLYAYNGLPELAVSSIDAVMQTEGNTVDWPTIAPADLQNYVNKPVTIENAVFSAVGANSRNLIFKVGEEEFTVYNQWNIDRDALETGKAYKLTGIGSVYKDAYQLYLVSFEEQVEEPEPQWAWADIRADFTNGSFFTAEENQSVISAGLKMNADGTFTRVAADDETANAIITGKYHSNEHGLANFSATVKVEGPVKVSMGTCAWGGDVTVKNAEGETVATFNTNTGACYHNDKVNNIVSAFYKGEATTLTISGGSYTPFFAVEAVDPADIPNDAKVTFVLGDEANDVQGVVPAEMTVEIGSTITIPANRTLYWEGFTLVGWTNGGEPLAPGTELTITEDTELYAVWQENTVGLNDRTEAVTVKWDFQQKNGAPSVQWQNQDNLVWVAQANVAGKIIDVALPFSTNPGKFNNTNWTDWCQLNNGTKFTVPSCKGATISIEAFNELGVATKEGQALLSIDGQTDYTTGKTVSYTIAGAAESVDVVIGAEGSYYRYIQVVLPKVEQQGGGETFDHVAGTINWPVGNEQQPVISDEIAGAISSASVSAGTDLTIESTSYFDTEMVKYTPKTGNAGNVEGVMIEYRVKPAKGVTFQPTQVDYAAVKVGTDNATYSWSYTVDGQESTITQVDPKPDLLRNNGSNSVENGGTAKLMHTETFKNVGECNEFTFRFYISACANNKNICIGNVTISGIVNGESVSVNMYELATAVAPAEGGSINVYPVSDQYEEGSEVKLTATENFGYDFVNWTNANGEVVSEEPVYTHTMNADETLTANFKAVETYELALTVDGTNDYMVKISPAPEMVEGKMMYEAGTAVQLQADQYEGLVTFTNWSDGETSSSKLISMTENTEITAYYAQADIIAGWDFYTAGANGRKADFYAQDNDADALNLVNTESGETSGWLDKSTLGGGGYESFKGAAVNWRTGTKNGDVGNWHWQTKINAEAFTDINVQFQMLYNYNAYQTYNAEYSLDGENWTGFGSVTMNGTRQVGTFKQQLPTEANNQTELYLRMIADKNSKVDGTGSTNDGNTLAMFFITGTPKLVDDGTAPVLVSSVPADGATGASASGKIVLTFDERVKLADTFMPTATLGNQTLTPAVSGKTVTFEYKGLEYSTEYTFTLPGGSIADLTNNFIVDPITLSFTTMVRPSVTKGLYDYVVEDVEDLVAAINQAATRNDQNTRYRIFIKNGEYILPRGAVKHYRHTNGKSGSEEVVYWEGDQTDPITYFNASNVSFIGESRDGVIITNDEPDDDDVTFTGQYGKASVFEGIGQSDVFQIGSRVSGLYWQDLTVETGMADSRGRDIAIQDRGTKNIYKNVGLRGYQDTWTSNNDNGLYYFEDGYVRGRTDYMCGKGDIFWNRVELRQMKGGYAAVPSKPAKYGWIYKDCVINGDESGVDGNYTLGRPWGSGTPIALFIDTKMNVVPSAIGWNEMSGGWPARFAEYNSMTSTGSQVDLSGRKHWWHEGGKDSNPTVGEENNPVLTAEEALENSDLHRMYGDWDPTLATEQAPIPSNVVLNKGSKTLTWTDSNYALLYAIVKNGKVVDFTTEATYTVDDAEAAWAVRAANEMGGLCEASEASITTGISEMENEFDAVPERIYNINGIRVQKAQKGLYIVGGKKVVIK